MIRNSPSPRRIARLMLAAFVTQFGNAAAAQDSSFILEAPSPAPYTAAYLGNGAISLVTTPFGIESSPSFLAGVYDHTPGDVPRIAIAPAWNEVAIFNGSHWLNKDTPLSAIGQYRQILDMHDGLLRTTYLWRDGDKSIDIQVEQFVSRDGADLAAAAITITPQFAGQIAVRLPLRNWPPPHRYDLERIRVLEGEARNNPWLIWYPGHLEAGETSIEDSSQPVLSLLATAPGTGMKTGEAVAVHWTGKARVSAHKDANLAETELKFEVKPGQVFTVTKFAAIISSSTASKIREMAADAATAARRTGWERLLSASAEAWHKLWETDLVVEGDPNLQRTIHSMLFYLLGSVREDLDVSLGPMGLSSAGYYGHIFWDADTFMFPALVVLHPRLARTMVAFRSRTLPVARENAQKNGYQGAMYPWEAGPDGVETTPRFAAQNASSENHVNGDVALAAWQYWLASGDRDWLQNHCWPILRDTADFWASRVKYNARNGRYEISNVVAVNESEVGVANDPYTNGIAKKNLELALAAANKLHFEAHPRWREVAERMYVPVSSSSLLWYPLDRPFSPQQTRQAVEAMLSRIQNRHSGAMMGTEFYPILAAQIGDRSAIGQLLVPLCDPYLRPPFQVIAETPQNQNISFITGAGAFLQQFVFGYSGLRLGDGGLESRFRPVLPPGIRRLTLRNIVVAGARQTLVFE